MVDKKENNLLGKGLSLGYLTKTIKFTKGRGVFIYDESNNDYVDFCSGSVSNSIGHSHPVVTEFMKERIGELWNIHDYSSPFRLALLEKLNSLTPKKINVFQFYSGGSETIEAGLRAIQSFLPNNKSKIIGFKEGYHGKTLASRQLTKWEFPHENIPKTFQISFPDYFGLNSESRMSFEFECLTEFENLLKNNGVGVIVCEPILGAGGCLNGSKEFWDKFELIRKKYGVLLFVDEIFTGIGRTGSNFAFEHYGLSPDLIAFAKGIAGGFPAMVLAGKKEIMNSEPFGDIGGASTTYGGNPLSIGAMHITLTVYEEERLLENVKSLEGTMSYWLEQIKSKFDFVKDYRTKGLFGAFQINIGTEEENINLSKMIHKFSLENGVFLMLFNNMIRITPPLVISKEELDLGFKRLIQAFSMVQLNEKIQSYNFSK